MITQNKTQSLILEVIAGYAGIESAEIRDKLKEKGRKITYDTVASHLKKMTDLGLLSRRAIAIGSSWNYYYYISKGSHSIR